MTSLRHGAAIALSAALCALGWPVLAAGPSTPRYQITKAVALGAPDRWDYVVFDPPSHRIYVAHGDRISVVDGIDGSILGQVEGYPGGTHGVVILDALGRGYTDDGGAGEAAAFDLKTLKTIQRIKTDDDADAIAFDPTSGHVFVINGDSGTITVIDPKHDRALATVRVGGKLEFAVAGGDGKLYVNGAGSRQIIRLDTRSNRVNARWPISNCTSPHGLAIDTAGHRLFSSCRNDVLVVVDLDSGAIVATLPIGSGTDAAAFDPVRKRVFSSNGRDGTLSIIQETDPQNFVSLGSVKTAVSGRTMAIDPASGRIYVAAADVGAATAAGHAAPGSGTSERPRPASAIRPGSLRLLFLDPVP